MFVVVGVILAFILIAVFSNRATRQCRWREYRTEADSQWRCIHCGAETTGPRAETPKTCFRRKD